MKTIDNTLRIECPRSTTSKMCVFGILPNNKRCEKFNIFNKNWDIQVHFTVTIFHWDLFQEKKYTGNWSSWCLYKWNPSIGTITTASLSRWFTLLATSRAVVLLPEPIGRSGSLKHFRKKKQDWKLKVPGIPAIPTNHFSFSLSKWNC